MERRAPVTPPGAVTFVFEPRLDAIGALHARSLVEQTKPHTKVVLDFRRVRSADWFALATLFTALASEPASRVRLRGLCDHHLRLLEHLGIDVARFASQRRDEDDRSDAPRAAHAREAAPSLAAPDV
jgi:hypothetical protein